MITGLEHIGIAVSNLNEALEVYEKILGLKVEKIKVIEEEKIRTALISAGKKIKERGIVLVDEKPRIGVEGYWMAFLHPKSTKSVLIELCEK